MATGAMPFQCAIRLGCNNPFRARRNRDGSFNGGPRTCKGHRACWSGLLGTPRRVNCPNAGSAVVRRRHICRLCRPGRRHLRKRHPRARSQHQQRSQHRRCHPKPPLSAIKTHAGQLPRRQMIPAPIVHQDHGSQRAEHRQHPIGDPISRTAPCANAQRWPLRTIWPQGCIRATPAPRGCPRRVAIPPTSD